MLRARLGSLRLRGRLIVLVGAALLPVTLLAIAGLYLFTREQLASLERANVETVRALVGAVDGELNRSIAALQVLASAEPLAREDLGAFHAGALRAKREQPAWATVLLAEPSGRQLVNTHVPFGAALPERTAEGESFARLLESRAPVYGRMVVGPVVGIPVFSVRVPVLREGAVRYVLSAAMRPETMLEVIRRQKVPEGGLVTIFDSAGVIVARSRSHEQYVGKPVSEGFRKLITQRAEGWGASPTVDGQRVYAAYSLSPSSRWGVGLGIPGDVIDGPVRRSYLFLGAGALLSLALGVIAAILVARRITGPIGELRAAAVALGRGEPLPMVQGSIPELHDVAAALVGAARVREQAEAAREALLTREREARTLAEQASRSKDEFLAMLGHELRNPLAAIHNAAQVLRHAQGADASSSGALGILERQTQHLARLVDDLLDVERVVAGKITLARGPLELSAAARRVIATLEAAGRFGARRVTFEGVEAWIDADATRIDQIVTNLLVNAAKYTGERGRIEVRVTRGAAQAVLEVVDDGIGMDASLVPRVFDLFIQGERPLDRSQGGLGVGLTLVKRLTELHGGSVEAASGGANRGSTFRVRMPAIAAAAAADKTAAGELPAAPPREVLIVEDNADARAMLRKLLEVSGHTVHEAADGSAGFDSAVRLRPAFALIDLGLPGIDGYELARRLRAAPETGKTVLVALTGYGQARDRERALQAGFDCHLVKPVDLQTMQRVLRGGAAALRGAEPGARAL